MEYDYEKELLFHETAFGFRMKVYDILLVVFVLTFFTCFSLILVLKRWMTSKGPEILSIQVKPLQEIPHFKTALYQIKQEGIDKKNKKKTYPKYANTSQGSDKGSEKIFECVTCGFKVQKTSFA